MSYRLSEDAIITVLETADIGGTNAATGWVDMKGFHRAMALVELGTWNASDDLDEFRIEAAEDSSGTNSEEVTTDASGGNYDTDSPLDADGDQGIIEIRGEDLPEGKTFIRLYVAEGGNTGVDNITGILIRYEARDKVENKQGAASASRVYVSPHT